MADGFVTLEANEKSEIDTYEKRKSFVKPSNLRPFQNDNLSNIEGVQESPWIGEYYKAHGFVRRSGQPFFSSSDFLKNVDFKSAPEFIHKETILISSDQPRSCNSILRIESCGHSYDVRFVDCKILMVPLPNCETFILLRDEKKRILYGATMIDAL